MRETSLQVKRCVICSGTRASAHPPSVPDRVTPESLRDPVSVFMASTLCHSVVIVTLFPHVTGGYVKNIAVASCHSAVGDDVTELASMYHCPKCDPSPLDSEVDSTHLAVLLIVFERFRGSGRKSMILWLDQEVSRRVMEPLDTPGTMEPEILTKIVVQFSQGGVGVGSVDGWHFYGEKDLVCGPLWTKTVAGQRSEAHRLRVYQGLGHRGRDGHPLPQAGESCYLPGHLWDPIPTAGRIDETPSPQKGIGLGRRRNRFGFPSKITGDTIP